MSTFDNPLDPSRSLHSAGCACGLHVSAAEHERDTQLQCVPIENGERRYENVVASAVLRAIFPKDAGRRAFLQSLGASTALAAVSQFFPLKTATELFAAGGPIEKKDLKVGFIPITCATPIIMAKPMGFYEKHGLNVEVIKTAGWAVIRDKTLNKEYDAAHMLSPMPIAITMGVGSNAIPYTAPANYINQPVTVLEQILTGTFADGLGNIKTDANRVDFDPFPWQSFAVWIMTQMKRWGQIKGDVDYKGVAAQVFLATDTSKLMAEAGMTPPKTTSKTFVVMGKTFDPAKPEEYIKSFKIKKAV